MQEQSEKCDPDLGQTLPYNVFNKKKPLFLREKCFNKYLVFAPDDNSIRSLEISDFQLIYYCRLATYYKDQIHL